MDGALADAVFLDVTGRTAKRLLELAGESDEFTLPVTQEELAGMVGASRERVNKAIAQFVRLGWIEQNERRYRITNRQQMEIRARWPGEPGDGLSPGVLGVVLAVGGTVGVVDEAVLGALVANDGGAGRLERRRPPSAGVYGSAVPMMARMRSAAPGVSVMRSRASRLCSDRQFSGLRIIP